MKTHTAIAVLLSAAVLSSCGTKKVQSITGPVAATARIRFFNFGVNAPAVNFYANDVKMTAISSATGVESNLGTSYGSVGAGGYYNAISPGQYTVNSRITAVTDNGLQITKANVTIADGKSYSFYMSGFYDPTAKSADGFLVEDPLNPTIDWSQAYVRFVNTMSNANPLILYAKSQTTGTEVPLGGAVAYKSAGVFTPLANDVYDLSARYAGSTTNTIVRTSVSFAYGRVYTISARGDITVTSSSATNRPFLDNTANR